MLMYSDRGMLAYTVKKRLKAIKADIENGTRFARFDIPEHEETAI